MESPSPERDTPTAIELSDSSDFDYSVKHQSRKMPYQLKLASVDQDAPSKVPMLLAGDITPAVMCKFEDACIGYFENKEIVRKILAGLKDDRVKEWLSVECERVQTLTFPEFMLEFCTTY